MLILNLSKIIDTVWQDIAYCIQDMDNHEIYAYDADQDFFAASIYKLSLAMLYEDMIAEGDVYLTEQYTQQYKETVESGIRELAEQEGIVLNRCQIVLSEDEIKLSRIELEIDTDDGTVQESEVEKVHISLTETEEQTETESADIIKLKNNIIDIYGIGEENMAEESSTS